MTDPRVYGRTNDMLGVYDAAHARRQEHRRLQVISLSDNPVLAGMPVTVCKIREVILSLLPTVLAWVSYASTPVHSTVGNHLDQKSRAHGFHKIYLASSHISWNASCYVVRRGFSLHLWLAAHACSHALFLLGGVR